MGGNVGRHHEVKNYFHALRSVIWLKTARTSQGSCHLFIPLHFLQGTHTSSADATASRMRFKDRGFNLTKVLINFGPDSPKDTYCYSVALQPSTGLEQTAPRYKQAVGPKNSLVLCTTTFSFLLRFADTKTCWSSIFLSGEINNGHTLTQTCL